MTPPRGHFSTLFDFETAPHMTPPTLTPPSVDAAQVAACRSEFGG